MTVTEVGRRENRGGEKREQRWGERNRGDNRWEESKGKKGREGREDGDKVASLFHIGINNSCHVTDK